MAILMLYILRIGHSVLNIKRDDISKFLVHLTKEYDSNTAEENLLNILEEKTIYALNAHCLFHYDFDRLELTKALKKQFNTVCFTETPLAQLSHLTARKNRKKSMLDSYGLVFVKDQLLQIGASPAIYINTNRTQMRDFLLNKFRSDFRDITTLKQLEQKVKYYRSKIQYYSLINIISSKYNFTWEREWRINGDFKFKYREVFAIIAKDPDEFLEKCREKFSPRIFNYINRIPVISLDWNYEDMLEELAIQLWDKFN